MIMHDAGYTLYSDGWEIGVYGSLVEAQEAAEEYQEEKSLQGD